MSKLIFLLSFGTLTNSPKRAVCPVLRLLSPTSL